MRTEVYDGTGSKILTTTYYQTYCYNGVCCKPIKEACFRCSYARGTSTGVVWCTLSFYSCAWETK